MDARITALSALIACRKQNAWSDGSLKEYIVRDRLDRRDAALATRLCYGVLQNRMLLDFYLSSFLKGRLKDLQPVVADILRLGAYQLVFLEKIPASAAVNEAVDETRRYANSRAAGLVNAVLRALASAAAEKRLPEPKDLAVRYSHPAPLVELLRDSLGEARLEPFLRCDNEAPETVVQRNPLKTKGTDLFLELQNQEVSIRRHSWLPDCYCLSGTGSIETMADFRDGKFYVQDAAAHLAAMVYEQIDKTKYPNFTIEAAEWKTSDTYAYGYVMRRPASTSCTTTRTASSRARGAGRRPSAKPRWQRAARAARKRRSRAAALPLPARTGRSCAMRPCSMWTHSRIRRCGTCPAGPTSRKRTKRRTGRRSWWR